MNIVVAQPSVIVDIHYGRCYIHDIVKLSLSVFFLCYHLCGIMIEYIKTADPVDLIADNQFVR